MVGSHAPQSPLVVPLDLDGVGQEADEEAAAADPGSALAALLVLDGDVVDGLVFGAAEEERAAEDVAALGGEEGVAVLVGPGPDDVLGAGVRPAEAGDGEDEDEEED